MNRFSEPWKSGGEDMAPTGKCWFALEITVDQEAVEAIEFALNELDAVGTEINSLGKLPSETLPVIGYFVEKPEDETVRNQIAYALRIHGFPDRAVRNFGWTEIGDQDWLAEWKKHWKPTGIGRFIIAPPWETVEDTDKIVIQIEPKMAFGTGTHETTGLCLKTIGELYRPEQRFLDVGTGTGILSIAAAKLGGSSILACDTDADSITIARENAIANHVSDKIEFRHAPIDDETPVFDFVCANLTIDVIVPMLPLLVARSRAVLLLSGILSEQKEMIIDELERFQISDFTIQTAGEWISVTLNPGQAFGAETPPVYHHRP